MNWSDWFVHIKLPRWLFSQKHKETSSSLLKIFGSGSGLCSYKELLPFYLLSYLKEVVILGLTLWKVI